MQINAILDVVNFRAGLFKRNISDQGEILDIVLYTVTWGEFPNLGVKIRMGKTLFLMKFWTTFSSCGFSPPNSETHPMSLYHRCCIYCCCWCSADFFAEIKMKSFKILIFMFCYFHCYTVKNYILHNQAFFAVFRMLITSLNFVFGSFGVFGDQF